LRRTKAGWVSLDVETLRGALIRVHLAHAFGDRRRRVALEVDIERGVNPHSRRLEIAVLKVVPQTVVHQVDKIGSVGRFGASARNHQRRADGIEILILGNVIVLEHGFQHDVTACLGPLRPADRIAVTGDLDKTRERRGLRQSELPYIFAEKGLRRFAESSDGK